MLSEQLALHATGPPFVNDPLSSVLFFTDETEYEDSGSGEEEEEAPEQEGEPR